MKRLVLALIFAWSLPAADDAPPWLRELASASLPAYGAKVPAVVLLNEESVALEEGRMVSTSRYAVKVLTAEGREHAEAHRVYVTGSGKVRDMRGWIIHPTGAARKLGKDETIDVAGADNDVYNEVRVRAISATRLADPGAVFGFESVVEDRSVFAQMDWQFQNGLPVLTSRLTVTLPPGWEHRSFVFNHTGVKPESNGNTHCWQLEKLPHVEPEEGAPSPASIVPRIALSFLSPGGAGSEPWKSFANWGGVAAWASELNESQSQPDGALSAKAQELTASATSLFEKVKTIGAFAQRIKYVSIQTGIGRGGGYRPHLATEVFQKGYGDCKDKANLMRAMLRAIGVSSYPVMIYAGDRTYVRAEWPTPQQFNHAIIAISAPAEWDGPAIGEYPKLGRLLFFDPTDDDTPAGQLPHHEQNSLALIVKPEGGELVRVPLSAPKHNLVQRSTDVVLEASGAATVSMTEKTHGRNAVDQRRLSRAQSQPDFRKSMERWISANVKGPVVQRADQQDEGAGVALTLQFIAPAYAQSMQGRLLVFRPAIVPRAAPLSLREPSRRLPVLLEPELFEETARVKLPAGFHVDEIPEAILVEAPFGRYEAKYETEEGAIILRRSLEVRHADLPPEAYHQLRDFFLKVGGYEQTPVVLAR